VGLMKISTLATFVAFISLQITLQSASATSYEYDWIGGRPGYSGSIFLDASSSALALNGGTDADLLPGSFVSTPFGTFSVVDRGIDAGFYPSRWSWDAARISLMGLFLQPTTPIFYQSSSGRVPATAWVTSGVLDTSDIQVGAYSSEGFETHVSTGDQAGQWLAVVVPEPSAVGLLALGGAAIIVCRRDLRLGRA